MEDLGAPTLRLLGDAALLVDFGTRIDPAINARVLAACRAIVALGLRGVRDVVPAYASLAVHLDPGMEDPDALGHRLLEVCSAVTPGETGGRCVDVPVCYEPDFAPDMDELCAHTGLSPAEVIVRHSRPGYRVYFLGFTPGFPYLGGLDPALAMPRRDAPRTRVAAGSVAIGGAQTGIYPSTSPGGWRIIGRTPLRLFDPSRDSCCLLAPGDTLRFVPVSRAEFSALSGGT